MTNINKNTQTTFILGLPSDIMKEIETQLGRPSHRKNAVTLAILQNGIFGLHITERSGAICASWYLFCLYF